MTDAELIEQHRQGSQEAFAELVRRHIDWVYSAARRRLGDSHLADDVTQAAFIALAKKKPRLWPGSPLAPWLLTVVNLSCRAALRSESTRRRHETKAATMRSEIEAQQGAMWEELSPYLDELVERLGRTDRTAIMLRFYQQKSFAEVGASLGISEEAARKRTSRAVEQLRSMLGQRGVTTTSTALSALLAIEIAKPAPAALAGTIIAGAASATGAVTAAAIAKGAIAIMAWTKVKITVGSIVAVLLVAGGGAGVAIHYMKSSDVHVAQTPAPTINLAPQPSDPSEYYVGGSVSRSGVYSAGSRDISVLAALIAAGIPDAELTNWSVVLTRANAPTKPALLLDNVQLSELMPLKEPPVLPPRRDGRARPAPDLNRMWPEGANLLVKGGDQIVLQPATKMLDEQFIWGPVREVTFSMRGNANRALNLEQNKLLDVPSAIDLKDYGKTLDQLMQWSIENEADLICGIEGDNLTSQGVVMTQGYRSEWDAISPQLVRLELRSKATPPKWDQKFGAVGRTQGLQDISIFRTRSGLPGKLQQLDWSDATGTVHVRYCIGERAQSATRPATQP